MSESNLHSMSKEAETALLHEMWHVDGRVEALRFAWDCDGDLARIRTRLHEVKESIYNPPASLKDRMAPGASTREYQEGYLQGLTDILGILENISNSDALASDSIVARRA